MQDLSCSRILVAILNVALHTADVIEPVCYGLFIVLLLLCSMQVSIETTLIRNFGPQKKKFSQAVTCIQLLPSGTQLLGTGEGLLVETQGPPNFRRTRSTKFPAGISSIALRGNGNQVFVGLCNSQMYVMEYHSLEFKMVASCHSNAITSIVFPRY